MNEKLNIDELNEVIQSEFKNVELIKKEIGNAIIGQNHMIDRLIIGLIANGHILLEGVPGLAKTLVIKSLAQTVDASFKRIQFTPDLLPADLTGTMIYSQKNEEFKVKKGPIFAHFVLADEINRAPAKVQSALLEAMQEKQITIGEDAFQLPNPFFVLATQNPIEQDGTYTLPEAQIDRFLMKIIVKYPSKDEEKIILRRQSTEENSKLNSVISIDRIKKMQEIVKKIYLDEKIENYITDIVFATRFPNKYNMNSYSNLIKFGASPRASINFAIAAKALAFINQRGYVIPEDIRNLAQDILRHRIGLTYEAEALNVTSEQIIIEILNNVKVP